LIYCQNRGAAKSRMVLRATKITKTAQIVLNSFLSFSAITSMIAKNLRNKKNSKIQDVFFSVVLAALFLGAIASLIISNYRIKAERAEKLEKIEALKKQIEDLEEQNNILQLGISQATSTVYQEEKMREQGYQKPGEQNVVVVPPEKKPEIPVEEQKSWWERFLDKINF